MRKGVWSSGPELPDIGPLRLDETMHSRDRARPDALEGPEPAYDHFFREVALDEVGRVAEPHYVRTGALVLWVASPVLAGAFATGPQRLPDLAVAVMLYERLFPESARRALLSDARGFGVDRSVFDAMIREVPGKVAAAGLAPARIALLMPTDWSQAWWVGVVSMGQLSPLPTRAFFDEREAWRWLGAREEERVAVQALTSRLSPSAVQGELKAQLQADPSLTIQRAAHLLGTSARSVQRALSAAGETFADLKARARADLAIARLVETDDKIDAVATFAGFRSRSHFVSWFRRVTGKSPGDFRQSQKPKDA